MDFLSFGFLMLVITTVFLTRISKTSKQQNIIILASNVLFYALWSVKFLLFLVIEGEIIFLLGTRIVKTRNERTKKQCLMIGIGTALLMLAIFKYYNFFVDNISRAGIGLRGLNIVAPIGISFYTFMVISFIVDVYKGKIDTQTDLLVMFDYYLFFPTIVSGPISKARDILPQFKNYRVIDRKRIEDSVCRFTIGAFKKVVIADRLSIYVDTVFETPNAYSWVTLILGGIAYSVQLYCDFAGYSDMAIAVAGAVGIDVSENFLFPYMSKNPTEFWKRWHISLSSWLQEYLYIPLGGNRKGIIRTYINLIITMTLGGLWHGANWTFILWGMVHGIALVLHKQFTKIAKVYNGLNSKRLLCEIKNVLCITLNCVFVSCCWIVFRSDSVQEALIIFKRIVTLAEGIQYIYVYNVVFVIGLVIIQIIVSKRTDKGKDFFKLDLSRFSNKVILCGEILIIFALGYYGDTAFIYGKF